MNVKATKYMGYTITYTKRFGMVWAKAKAISKQYIGSGKTKREAQGEAEDSIDYYLKARRKK